jgi:hypothetical protein
VRTGRYFIWAKAGAAMTDPKKDRVESSHRRRDMFSGFFIRTYHQFGDPKAEKRGLHQSKKPTFPPVSFKSFAGQKFNYKIDNQQ